MIKLHETATVYPTLDNPTNSSQWEEAFTLLPLLSHTSFKTTVGSGVCEKER